MENFQEQLTIMKAFCDENRLRILSMLREGSRCACKILEELQISQSTLSHHMKILCESGVVECWNEGKWTHYRISKTGSKKAVQLVEELTNIN